MKILETLGAGTALILFGSFAIGIGRGEPLKEGDLWSIDTAVHAGGEFVGIARRWYDGFGGDRYEEQDRELEGDRGRDDFRRLPWQQQRSDSEERRDGAPEGY